MSDYVDYVKKLYFRTILRDSEELLHFLLRLCAAWPTNVITFVGNSFIVASVSSLALKRKKFVGNSSAVCGSFMHVGLLETYRYKRTGQFFIWNYIGNWYVFSKYLDNYCRYQYCANDTLFRNISFILRSIFQDILPKKMSPFARQPTLTILI